jgi:hypothetical protein
MCKNFREKGVCKYGDKCLFAHGEHELTRRTPEVKPEIEAKIVINNEAKEIQKEVVEEIPV